MSERTTSEVTRYLSSAAYLNPAFRKRFLRTLWKDRYRAIGTSPSVDLEVVARHCFAAEARERVYDLVLVSVAILGLSAFGALGAFRGWPAFAIGTPLDHGPSLVVVLLALSLWSVVLREAWSTRVEVVAQRLSREHFRSDDAPRPTTPRALRTIAEIAEWQQSNVTVYSGFSPFVGAGIPIGGWSFALDLEKGSKPLGQVTRPDPVDLVELYVHLGDAVESLDLEGASIEDRVFVAGRDVCRQPHLLPDVFGRPSPRLADDALRELVAQPTTRIRHYRCIRVSAWEGQVVLSLFLRLSRVGNNLFVEAEYCLLPPLLPGFHAVDHICAEPTSEDRIRLALAAVTGVLPRLVVACIRLPTAAWSAAWDGNRQRRLRHRIRRDTGYDYGAFTSAREEAADWEFRHFFQSVDPAMIVKVLDRKLLDSLADFLDKHDVDTSDLREQQTVILNYNVITPGGSIHGRAVALAVGRSIPHRLDRERQP